MTTMTCPHCRHMLEVADLGPEPTAKERRQDTIDLAPPGQAHEESMRAYRTVHDLVNRLAREGREIVTSRDITDLYNAEIAKGAPKLTPNALARALKACGCANWRSDRVRGFKLPTNSHLLTDDLGKKGPHIPHTKGRTLGGDIVAYHSIDRLPDGTPVFDNPREHTEGPLAGGPPLKRDDPLYEVEQRIAAGLPPF